MDSQLRFKSASEYTEENYFGVRFAVKEGYSKKRHWENYEIEGRVTEDNLKSERRGIELKKNENKICLENNDFFLSRIRECMYSCQWTYGMIS